MESNMIILYNSKTGFTRKYAQLLAEELFGGAGEGDPER